MPDRRINTVTTCQLHAPLIETVQRLEEKFGIFHEQQVHLIEDVAHVKKRIDNGLRQELKDVVKESLDAFDRKYQGVLEFNWFREFATSFRDKLFANTIKAVGLIILLLFFMHMGNELFATVLKGIKG